MPEVRKLFLTESDPRGRPVHFKWGWQTPVPMGLDRKLEGEEAGKGRGRSSPEDTHLTRGTAACRPQQTALGWNVGPVLQRSWCLDRLRFFYVTPHGFYT